MAFEMLDTSGSLSSIETTSSILAETCLAVDKLTPYEIESKALLQRIQQTKDSFEDHIYDVTSLYEALQAKRKEAELNVLTTRCMLEQCTTINQKEIASAPEMQAAICRQEDWKEKYFYQADESNVKSLAIQTMFERRQQRNEVLDGCDATGAKQTRFEQEKKIQYDLALRAKARARQKSAAVKRMREKEARERRQNLKAQKWPDRVMSNKFSRSYARLHRVRIETAARMTPSPYCRTIADARKITRLLDDNANIFHRSDGVHKRLAYKQIAMQNDAARYGSLGSLGRHLQEIEETTITRTTKQVGTVQKRLTQTPSPQRFAKLHSKFRAPSRIRPHTADPRLKGPQKTHRRSNARCFANSPGTSVEKPRLRKSRGVNMYRFGRWGKPCVRNHFARVAAASTAPAVASSAHKKGTISVAKMAAKLGFCLDIDAIATCAICGLVARSYIESVIQTISINRTSQWQNREGSATWTRQHSMITSEGPCYKLRNINTHTKIVAARKEIGKRFEECVSAAIEIERVARGWEGRTRAHREAVKLQKLLHFASIHIQRVARGWKGRKLARYLRQQMFFSAVQIERVWRGSRARVLAAEIKTAMQNKIATRNRRIAKEKKEVQERIRLRLEKESKTARAVQKRFDMLVDLEKSVTAASRVIELGKKKANEALTDRDRAELTQSEYAAQGSDLRFAVMPDPDRVVDPGTGKFCNASHPFLSREDTFLLGGCSHSLEAHDHEDVHCANEETKIEKEDRVNKSRLHQLHLLYVHHGTDEAKQKYKKELQRQHKERKGRDEFARELENIKQRKQLEQKRMKNAYKERRELRLQYGRGGSKKMRMDKLQESDRQKFPSLHYIQDPRYRRYPYDCKEMLVRMSEEQTRSEFSHSEWERTYLIERRKLIEQHQKDGESFVVPSQ